MKLIVLPHNSFDEDMRTIGLNDENVESANMGFISIIGTRECLEYYLNEGYTRHYFKDHQNVLNLEFDDLNCDVLYDGHLFKTMTIEQAEKTVDFIERMIENGVDVIEGHCRAGLSRSRAVFEFIYRYCMENGIDVSYEDRDIYVDILNHSVLRLLNHAYMKKHAIGGYEEYPSDITSPKVEIITKEE